MKNSIVLIQPRHCYARRVTSDNCGHTYFPTALYTMAARLRTIGFGVVVRDENISPWSGEADVVGVSCIGSPYFPVVASRLSELREQGVSKLIVGGQGVSGLTESEFAKLFGADTINASNEQELVARQVLPQFPPAQECVSICDEIGSLDDETFRKYFSSEVPLYLSQGCRFRCTFCAAIRSNDTNPRVREAYRQLPCVEAELHTIVEKSQALGLLENSFYLSNLDLFQTPDSLGGFVASVRGILAKWPGHRFHFRGLSTTTSFLVVQQKSPNLIEEFAKIGLDRVGFGIDGATEKVWKAIRKPQSKNSLRAIALAREQFGLQPEALMVFGHADHDNQESLSLAVDTVKRLSDEYGAIPRPHVAKGLVPGNDGWRVPAAWQRDFLLENPWAFQFLDFTCLPTDVTHEDPALRDAVKKAFLEICSMPNCLTQYVMPEDQRLPVAEFQEVIEFNEGRFDI